MIKDMKLVIGTAFILVLACACKLETSSATNRNANANSNANANRATVETASAPQAVSNCGLAMPAAPTIDGLKLRMTPAEVLALFPKSDQDADIMARVAKAPSKFGEQGFLVKLDNYPPKIKSADLTRVDVTFLDGRAYIYNFGYNGPKYAQVDDFVTKVVQGTSLPPVSQWQDYVGLETQLKTLTCKDFEVRVFAGGEGGNLNYVLLTDLEADKTVKERRAKAKAQAKPTPNP
jgi:hypothetical protein